jgi:monofunctional biosynthetic peptidoglycan transglycosylase
MISWVRKWLFRLALLWLFLTLALVLPLRWFDPPSTAFMLQERWLYQRDVVFRPLSYEAISPHLALAVVAAEDQKFPHHWGFDQTQIQHALSNYRRGEGLRGASTITQQLAKNLYLWPGRSFVRKGMEAWLAMWLELCLPKRRILEIYLNVIEFDTGVYGAEAGAQHYFGRPAAELSADQAALLAAVLPAPKRLNAASPDEYMQQRQAWIRQQMRNLGPAWLP